MKLPRLLTKKVVIIGGVAALALASAAFLYSRNQTPPTETPTNTPADQGSNSSTDNNPSNTPPPATKPATTPTTPTATPKTQTLPKPTGQLLSNHSVSLSGNSDEESACQTVVGAKCNIKLTGPGGGIYLGAQSVDSNGATIFDWNAKQRHLTVGQWKVEAIATKNGQTATSNPEYLTVRK